ncbi:hypothetical protein A4X13_0g8201 [Tilletia indica]|uniref:Uncharacterized protein n=1 Tax=Tilletia indica TaxID=43049 RepID=A0A8T8SGB2_9BASI|nr:hypothetical protein A4X13_0g8201 [Tilletia indica]
MKDITLEEVTRESAATELHLFGAEVGPVPTLEHRLVNAVNSTRLRRRNASTAYDLRFYWDLWYFLCHVLLLPAVSFLSDLIKTVEPGVIRV